MTSMVLGGCSGSADDSESGSTGVASIPSNTTAGQAASSPASAEGPQARIDTPAMEITRWQTVYLKCLKDHGTPGIIATGGQLKGNPEAAPPAALTACASKKPNSLAPELDPKKNPDYDEQFSKMVKCLQDKGFKIRETEEGWTFTEADPLPPNDVEIELECQVQAFTKK